MIDSRPKRMPVVVGIMFGGNALRARLTPIWVKDCLKSMRDFADCDIIINTDLPQSHFIEGCDIRDATKIFKGNYLAELVLKLGRENRDSEMDRMWALSTLHWIAVCEMVLRDELPLPILVADWDVMMFGNAAQAIQPWLDCDCGVALLKESGSQSPMFLGSKEAARKFLKYYRLYIDPRNFLFSEMTVWSELYANPDSGLKVGDLGKIHNGSVYDGNVGFDDGIFEMEKIPEDNSMYYKRIVWNDGVPHFVKKDTQHHIRANQIHCWMAYKQKTGQLLHMALTKHCGSNA